MGAVVTSLVSLVMIAPLCIITTAFPDNYAALFVQRACSRQQQLYNNRSRKRQVTHLSFSSNARSIQEEIRYIAGRRALILHPPPNTPQASNPPLVILGGMAQSISSWEFHLQQLSPTRSVMVYEALGQGPPPPSEVCSIDGSEVTLEQYYDDVTLERQGRDFWAVVDEAFFQPESYYSQNNLVNEQSTIQCQVDVAGFSFGGRVAMAAATIQPKRIRKLHLTGVGAERDEFANVILTSWKEILGADSTKDTYSNEDNEECDPELHSSKCTSRLRAFAWSIILATYSEKFLASAGSKRVQSWVDGVCQYNTEEGIKALLMQTHGSFLNDRDQKEAPDLWTPAAMAQRIKTDQCVEECKVLVGANDKMSSPVQAIKLAQLMGLLGDSIEGKEPSELTNSYFRIIEGGGHAVPMESQRLWRDDVNTFLTG
jgi:pimeloyl-ACP methyl ester carboxylesterase